MAKLKAPLLSFGASGAIAKAVVYFPWKGLNCAREYVIPSNPNTTLQQAQRGHLTHVVAKIHLAQVMANALDETDVMAYALWGSIYPTPRTWFNQAVKGVIDDRVAGNTGMIYGGGKTTHGADKLDVEIHSHLTVVNTGVFKYGTSKTALINSKAATIAGTKISASINGLVTGVKYFWQFFPATPATCKDGKSGIYYGRAA